MNKKRTPDYGSADSNKEYKLCLCVTGWTPRCVLANKNLNRICAEHLENNCDIEVIDLLENPEIARREQIVAVPKLVKMQPKPQRVLVSDFSQTDKVLNGLGFERTN